MTSEDHNELALKAKELDDKLWELYQTAKSIRAANYLGDGDKWTKMDQVLAEIQVLETEFCRMSSQQLKR